MTSGGELSRRITDSPARGWFDALKQTWAGRHGRTGNPVYFLKFFQIITIMKTIEIIM